MTLHLLNGTSLKSMALHFSQWHCTSLNGTSVHAMALYCSQWHCTSLNGTSLRSMALHFCQWQFTSLNGTLFQSMAFHFTQWHFTAVNGTVLHSMALYFINGTSLHSMALHFSQWHFISVNGISFHSMALYFSQWHFISLNVALLQSMALYFTQWHFTSVNGTLLQSMALQFTQRHFTSVNGTSFQSMAFHFTQWHFTSVNGTSLHSMALHLGQWHFTSVNGTSFQSMALHFRFAIRANGTGIPSTHREEVCGGKWTKTMCTKKKSGMTPLLADGLGHFWRAKNALGSRLYAFSTRRPKANGWEGMPTTCDHHSKRLWNRSWNSKCVALPSKSAMFGIAVTPGGLRKELGSNRPGRTALDTSAKGPVESERPRPPNWEENPVPGRTPRFSWMAPRIFEKAYQTSYKGLLPRQPNMQMFRPFKAVDTV
ncbi:hypothetical protein niasHT_014916 [Heterodera trifolii]|uniref:Uncharacterized protein n=1 Tax=Heterodera trifolii TaxID=157864 RepID=A0ABD2LFU3_9BILA